MMLRPRQTLLVDRTLAALRPAWQYTRSRTYRIGQDDHVLGGRRQPARRTRCQGLRPRPPHELTGQNRAKFARVNPGLTTSVFDAHEKSWAGNATFAMVQTLSRGSHLEQMPTLDLLVIDEAHHARRRATAR
jgi:DNA repair protein RadD